MLTDRDQPTWLPQANPQLALAFKTRVIVNPPRALGNLHGSGERLIMTVGGGDASGKINGRILEGGTEWPLIRPDGADAIDARYSLETDDGVLINIRNTGYRVIPPDLKAKLKSEVVDASRYYFRTYTVLEAPVGKYDWVTRNVFIGFGERHPALLHLWYYQVL